MLTFAFPTSLRVGAGAVRQLPATLAALGLKRPLLVTDRYLLDNGLAEPALAQLRDAGVPVRIFADDAAEPTDRTVEAARAFLEDGLHDCIIGYGGGSPIDVAKVLAVVAVHAGVVRDYKAPHVQDVSGLPIIAIPTTAGTGSEVTRFAVISDEANGEKMLCAGLGYMPVAALVDFELTFSMPPRVTADTGIDALTHALEAYVSQRASPLSDSFALAALGQIAPTLRKVVADPQDRQARAAMMMGATLAGLAFSNSSVALVHGMSRPISVHFHVPHGLSNAMLLPAVTAYSAPAALGRYADCARAMGICGAEDDQKAVDLLVAELRSLNADLAVPTPGEFGIDADQWTRLSATMAAQALASGSPANNPRSATPDEIVQLYAEAWSG